MPRLLAFIALSGALAYLSRASLRVPSSHGFYRFFAWECILGSIFLNFESLEQWFGDPLSLHQLVSWLLLGGSLVFVTLGIHLLRTIGKPDAERRVGEPLLGIEKTTELVTTGVFGYVRHPLYSSLLLLAWGVLFKDPSWVGGALASCATGFLVGTAKAEEAENVVYFGSVYREYMSRTRMFIPFLF